MIDRTYPAIYEDQTIVEWFAGAALDFDSTDRDAMSPQRATRIDAGAQAADWVGGHVSLAFSDTGTFGEDPRSQLVMVYVPFSEDGMPGQAISLEVDRNDAIAIIKTLATWVASVGIESRNEQVR